MSDKIALGFDIGKFYTQESNENRREGLRYGMSLFYKHFTFRLGKNNFDRFSEWVPSLSYDNQYKRHSYHLEYVYQNALFYTKKPQVINERIKAHHFSFSDYVTFNNKTSLWANVELNKYSNNDKEVTAQFDWNFFHNQVYNSAFTYNVALEGWYTTHTKRTGLYYSPHFADSTLIRFEPQYVFSKYFTLKGIAGMGYSFSDKTTPYKYGAKIFGTPNDKLLYELGCVYNNSIRSFSNSSYDFFECNFSLGYSW